MATKKITPVSTPIIRQNERASKTKLRGRVEVAACDDCRAKTAFHLWRTLNMTPSFNWGVDFSASGIPQPGKRAVIELVTATISVPAGEKARLRMYTSLGAAASNLDLILTWQGVEAGQDHFVATHSLRVYTDQLISFNVHRDNSQTKGSVIICISGYQVDM